MGGVAASGDVDVDDPERQEPGALPNVVSGHSRGV